MPGACLNAERLTALLSGSLSLREEAELTAHLSECPACQARIEALSGATGWLERATKGAREECPELSVPDEPGNHGERRPSTVLEQVMENLETRSRPTAEPAAAPWANQGATPKQFGDYEILGELGRGGMGVVYRARQVKADRLVALKVIASGSSASPVRIERFRTEVRAVANLDHPNIVPVYEVGEHDGRAYFSMKLIEGKTLAAAIAEGESQIAFQAGKSPREFRDSLHRIARLMAVLAHTVHYAHERGVLHRDLKPGNVLLDAGGTPHLTDFGLAKIIESESGITRTQDLMGTPNYMAPEQARGKSREITTAADVYGLGAILYELLTGRPPFQEATPMAILHDLLHSAPVPPSSFLSGAARDPETICLKCLEKEPRRRYPTAAALADDLERFARGEPIHARPASRAEKFVSWCRREPRLASLAAALVIVFGLGFAGVVWQWRRAEHTAQRERQEHERAEAEASSARRHLYAADINLARRACEEGNALRALELLAAQRPQPGQEDLRGFEWYYLSNFCHQEQRSWSLAGLKSWKPGEIRNFAIAPKANLLGVVLRPSRFPRAFREANPNRPLPPFTNGTLLLVQDLTSGKVLGSTRLPKRARDGRILTPYDFQFSPDGQQIALKCSRSDSPKQYVPPHYLALWEVRAIRESREQASPPPDWAGRFPPAVEPETRRRLWLLGPGAPSVAPTWLSASGNRYIREVAFSGNHQWIGALEQSWEPFETTSRAVREIREGAVTVWDRATYSVITNYGPLKGVGPEWRLNFSRDDKVLSARSGGASGNTFRWETGSWRPLTNSTTRAGAEGPAFSPQINPDALTNIFRQSLVLARQTYLQRKAEGRLALSPDHIFLALGEGEAVELWDLHTGHLVRTFAGHTGQVRRLDFLPDGRTLVSVGEDGRVKFWEVAARDEARLLFSGVTATNSHAEPYFMLRSFSPDGRTGTSVYNQALLRNLRTGAEVVLASTRDRPSQVHAWVFSPDGTLAAGEDVPRDASSQAAQVKVWGTTSGTERASFEVTDLQKVLPALAFSPDSQRLAYSGGSGTTIVWDLKRKVELGRIPGRLLTFCGDDRHLAVTTTNGPSIWDLETGRRRGAAFLGKSEFAFSPDRRNVAVVTSRDSEPRPVILWDWTTGEQRRVLGSYEVTSLAFSPGGKTLAGITSEGAIRLWQVSTGDELFSLSGLPELSDLTFTPDGRALLARRKSSLYEWGAAKP